MKFRLHSPIGLVLAIVAFVLVAAPAYAGPGTQAADANERSATVPILGIAMQDANQRASGQSMDVVVRVIDAHERHAPQAIAPSLEIASNVDNGFPWTAVIGTSSAFVFALLVGASVIVVRHTRGRAFAG
jgi:hypothetical protein